MVKGYLEELKDGTFRVGAKDDDGSYNGPVASVEVIGRWLYIITDAHEGSAMLNLEALPYLQQALAILAERRNPS